MHSLRAKRRGQMSEAFCTTVFLTLSGGFQDAYTYMGRGSVFANAQTGNIVLLAMHTCEGNFAAALRYLVPLLSFAAGVFYAEHLHTRYKNLRRFHWRQLVVLLEIVLLFAVGFLPQGLNWLANALVSFVCAMQVQTFRKVNGNPYASTMCIGNLRSGVQHLYTFVHTRNRAVLQSCLQYFGVIALFAAGAGLGSVLTLRYGRTVIWCSCALLFISLCIMFVKADEAE